jgi:Rps23 Pro-64 3,4-dihydroxylase Tpa1-like proline 4-hydroxylase
LSHSQIYKFFNDIDTHYNPTELAQRHSAGSPVPYTIIDNFLPEEIFRDVSFEVDFLQQEDWTVFSNGTSYRKECRNFTNAPRIQSMAYSFQGSAFLKWIEQVTGIDKMVADPHYRGGGITRVSRGDSLGLHNDFNWNEQIRLTRRANIILYMNSEWDSSWGGDLEFWDFDRTECLVKIEPKPNRLAIWNYDERLIHGHPYPLNCPEHIARQNFIQFYYGSNATHETPPHRSQFI